jgi:NAD(P)-dependent dehydrogenase (short-subunit alcohol dehydrogenase family)
MQNAKSRSYESSASMKYVLVTGALGGMGRETVSLLCRLGYGVFALDRVAGEWDSGAIPLVADITDPASLKQACDKVCETTDKLCAIIHFAGVYMLDSLVEMKEDDIGRIFDINVLGAAYVNKAFLPLMSEGGRILITTSELASLDPLPFTGIYAVTKGALDKYAFSLAMELQLLGIRVSVLRAGAVDTGMLGVSVSALDRFCDSTDLYTCNAKRFKSIVEMVEARCVSPSKIARKAVKIIERKRPRFAYSINRNPLLLMLNILPKRLQLWAIKMELKP